LFVKALKQNLKIKTFIGTSDNAVKTQIWAALIAMLLLCYLQWTSRFGWSLANLVALLRINLFTHRDLMVLAQGTLRDTAGAAGFATGQPAGVRVIWTAKGGTILKFAHNPSETRISPGNPGPNGGCFGQQ